MRLVRTLRPPSCYRDYSLTVPSEAAAAGESSLNRPASVVRRPAQDAWRARTAPGEVAIGLSNLSCRGCRRGLGPEAVDVSKS